MPLQGCPSRRTSFSAPFPAWPAARRRSRGGRERPGRRAGLGLRLFCSWKRWRLSALRGHRVCVVLLPFLFFIFYFLFLPCGVSQGDFEKWGPRQVQWSSAAQKSVLEFYLRWDLCLISSVLGEARFSHFSLSGRGQHVTLMVPHTWIYAASRSPGSTVSPRTFQT